MGYKMKGSPLKAKKKTYSTKSDAPQDKKKDKKIAGEIFGQELQLNKDGKTYNARGQDYQVAGVTDIIADPKGILTKHKDKDGYIMDRDFTFKTKGDTTFITGVRD
jgi:hypothetical protein